MKENLREDDLVENLSEKEKFKYLDLLDDNSPRYFSEYDAEAKILQKNIDNPNVNNVAIVAKYGAGKSSVINTYLHNYRRTKRECKKNVVIGSPRKNNYTRITLSTFNNTNYDETAIERSILQQLLYSENKNKLPNSEIKRTQKTSIWNVLAVSFILFMFVGSIILHASVTAREYLLGVDSLWARSLFLALTCSISILFVYLGLYYKKLKRIKYKDFEAEFNLDKNNGVSSHVTNLINKFIDEILYFFECVKINLVIFEDLDRLPTTEIFAKLRELNTIINGVNKDKRKITFLYAVKDDLFQSEEERAKFFEFILPVVPVVNHVTTSDKLRTMLKNCSKYNEEFNLTERFIKSVSPYIPDMRILKNTMNDYIIMYSKIFEDSDAKCNHLSCENLFALSLYKNLFPYDYALLEKNRGLIPLVINMDKLRQSYLDELNLNLTQAEDKLEHIKNETLNSLKELKYMFLGQVGELNYRYGNERIAPVNVLDDKFSFDNFNHKYVEHPFHKGYYVDIKENKEIMTPSGDRYSEREKIILSKQENTEDEIKKEISEIIKRKQSIYELTFFNIVNEKGLNCCFPDNLINEYLQTYKFDISDYRFRQFKMDKNECVPNLDLEILKKQIDEQIKYLLFLVVNGYIDENYIEYTSNYKAQLISPRDAQFVADIQIKKFNFDYIPDDVQTVIRRLDNEDFCRSAIINKVLLDNIELIRQLDEKEQTNKYNSLIKTLSNCDDKIVFDSIEKYISIADDLNSSKLIKQIINCRTSLIYELIVSNKLVKEKMELAVCSIINNSINIKNNNKENVLSNYIGLHESYLDLLKNCDKKNVLNMISELKPVFKTLSIKDVDEDIQKFVIDNSLYELSLLNAKIVFGIKEDLNLKQAFYSSNLSLVMNESREFVKSYILSNINIYCKNILLNEEITLENENPNDIENLIKNDEIDIDIRVSIIKKSNIIINNISEINSKLYETLLCDEKLEPSWNNVFIAYKVLGYTDSIESFILNNSLMGEFLQEDEDGKDVSLNLFTDMICEYNCYPYDITGVLSKINAKYLLSQFDIDKILKDFSTLTNDGVRMVDKNFASAIKLGQIIFNNKDLDLLNKIPFSKNEYMNKYESDILKEFDTFFVNILPQNSTRTVVENGRYINKIFYQEKPGSKQIIENIISLKDVSVKIKKKLIEKCMEIIKIDGAEKLYAKFFIENKIPVPTKILWQFTNVTIIDTEEKKEMLLLSVENIDVAKELVQYKEYFKTLGGEWKKVYENIGKGEVEQIEINEQLLKALKNKGLLNFSKTSKIKEWIGVPSFIVRA